MKSGKLEHVKNGDPWILSDKSVRNHICCDCNLVHFVYEEKEGKNKFTTYWYRDDHETERMRKKEGVVVYRKGQKKKSKKKK